jgi:signal transduction histidine kinase/DNA-binding response OmpR family regulator/ligand-binding sensor domain-containing protein
MFGAGNQNRFSFYGIAIILVFSLHLFQVLHAQPPAWNITYFTTEDGLSSNHVNCVSKDSRGFIWVGTENGLNRFDGYSFTTLKLPTGEPHPLSRVKVLTIYEDREGILWIGTSDGLFSYNPLEPVTDIKQYRYLDKPAVHTYRVFQPVMVICEDKNGLFWLVCNDPDEGITREIRTFDRETGIFECVYPDSSFMQEEDEGVMRPFTTAIYSDSRGDLWFGTNVGLYRYDFESCSFIKYLPFPDSSVPFINWVVTIYEDRFGNFWISNLYGLSLFDREKLRAGPHIALDKKEWWYVDFHASVFNYGEDQDGYLWMHVNQSLVRIRPGPQGFLDQGGMEKWETDYSTQELNPMFSLFVENPWLVWLGVPDRGLCRVSVNRNEFRVIKPTYYFSWKLNLDYVHSLLIDSIDHLWFLSFYDDPIEYNFEKNRAIKYEVFPKGLGHTVETDPYGNLWFANRFGTVARSFVNQSGKREFSLFVPDSKNPAAITPRNELFAKNKGSASAHAWEHLFFRDRDGTLWFNSGRGIHDRYDESFDGFVHLDHRIPDYVNNDTCVEAEVKGEIWFPSSEGLLRLLPPFTERDPFTLAPEATILYRNVPGDDFSLNADWVRTIYFSKTHEPGTLWIGTIGGGLNRMVKKQVEGTDRYEILFRHYTTADGLCDNNVLGIIEDRRGCLWLSTLNGLSRFDPSTEVFHNFYRKDGLPTNSFSWANPAINSSGEIFFPTEEGILYFHPDSIRINQEPPPVHITGFEIYNEPVFPGDKSPLKKDITATPSLELSYRQNFLSFEYAALNFEQPEKNRYQFMLEGFESDWTNAGTRRYAEYRGLKPGTYTFRVKGSNNSGVWNEEGAALEILIKPPPWQKWWAYIIYSLLFVGALLWYRRIILNRQKLKAAVEIERLEKEKIREIDSIRSRFFTNITHEFRTPLTLLSGPLEESLKAARDPVPMEKNMLRVMLRNTRRLLRLINQLLDISRIESGSMKLLVSAGPLAEFVRSIASSYVSLAESRQIDFSISVEETDADCWFDADKLEKILCNLLSNAFKFTPDGGSVALELRTELQQSTESPRLAVLRVSDTGKGIAPENLDRVFDRFYQVSGSDAGEDEGTGIGLALTREMVELMHGEISLESQIGKGTTFTLSFPVDKESFSDEERSVSGKPVMGSDEMSVTPHLPQEPGTDLETLASEDRGSAPGYGVLSQTDTKSADEKPGEQLKEVILVVEDNADLRQYICRLFTEGYTVEEAVNGSAGLERAIEIIPDLVITDIMMPVMDGMELCKRLKAHPATNHIPVIMLTAKADRESKLRGMDVAADDYIVKPFDPELIKARVRNLISLRRELRKRFEKDFLMEADSGETASPAFHMLREIMKVFDRHLAEPDFGIEALSREMHMSRSQLYRKVYGVSGTSPMELLRLVRMRHAARLLRSGKLNISQVMYSIGMQNTSHFASSFRKYFGVNPSEYGKQG